MEESTPQAKFICPNCGEIAQDDVAFLCNTCQSDELKEVDGMFICSSCETSAHPLQCRICDSKEVHLHGQHLDIPQGEHTHKD
jgi:hypothetical protein